MSRVLIIYYSKTGNTKGMAQVIEKELKEENIEVESKPIEYAKIEDMLDFDAILIGSPTYYGSMAGVIKQFFDDSVKLHGKLTGKVGGAFTSSGNIGGGNETTIMDILKAFLIHGMIIQGDYRGDHYGPVSIGKLDSRSIAECKKYAKNIASLVKRLSR